MSTEQFGVAPALLQGSRRIMRRLKPLVPVGSQNQLLELTRGYSEEDTLDTQLAWPEELGSISPVSGKGVVVAGWDILSGRHSAADFVHGTGSYDPTDLNIECLPVTEARYGVVLPGRPERPTLQDDIRKHLLRSIDEVERQASKPDWDGDGAVPLQAGTAAVARDLVGCFPPMKVPPEVSASPRGEIDFDWDIDQRVSLIVCVCRPPRHDIVFLATNGDAEVRGREPWGGELPQLVRCCFERMKGYL